MAWATSAEIRNDFLKEKNDDKIPDDLTFVIGVTIFAGKDKLFVVGIGRIFNLKTVQIHFFLFRYLFSLQKLERETIGFTPCRRYYIHHSLILIQNATE